MILHTRAKLCIGRNESKPERKALLRKSGHTAGNDRYRNNRKEVKAQCRNGVRSLSECNGYGQAGLESVLRREFAWRGRRADDATVSLICDSVVMGYAVAAASCNKQTTRPEVYVV